MAITFVGAATGGVDGSTASVTVADITNLQDGDFLVASCGQDLGIGYTWSSTGWSAEQDGHDTTAGRDMNTAYLYKTASSESGTWDFVTGQIFEKAVVVTAWRGVDTSSPIHASTAATDGTNDANPTCATVTTTGDAMVVTQHNSAGPDNSATYSAFGAPSGWTLAGAHEEVASDNHTTAVAYQAQSGAGTPTAGVWTHTDDGADNNEWHVRAIALEPAAGGAELTRTAADAVDYADAAGRLGGFVRGTTEAVDHADVVTRLGAFARSVADALGLADEAILPVSGYLLPEYVREEDYLAGTGTITLAFTLAASGYEEGDIFLLAVECRSSQTPTTDFGDWTYLDHRATSDGTLAGCALFAHRFDGSTLPTVSNLPDTGNHTSYSLHTVRNIDRNIALTDFYTSGAVDNTPDTAHFGHPISPSSDNLNGAGSTLESGRKAVIFWATMGDTTHGGSSDAWNVSNGWASLSFIRTGGHSQHSGGTHATATGRCDLDSDDSQRPQYTVTNSMTTASLHLAMPGHAYEELVRTATDTAGFSDAVAHLGAYVRAVAEAVDYADVVTRLGAYARNVTDSTDYSDAAVRVLGAVRSIADSLGSSDTATRVLSVIRTATDATGYADVVSRILSYTRTTSDALASSDVAGAVKGLSRALTEGVAFSDEAKALISGTWAAVKTFVEKATAIVTDVFSATDVTTYVESATEIDADVELVHSDTEIQTFIEKATDIEVIVE